MHQLDEIFGRVLAVVAHPDDLEYGASSALAKGTSRGKWVGHVIVNDGEAGIDGMIPADAAAIRRHGEVASAAFVGVSDVILLVRLGRAVDPADFLEASTAVTGGWIGAQHAVCFTVLRNRSM